MKLYAIVHFYMGEGTIFGITSDRDQAFRAIEEIVKRRSLRTDNAEYWVAKDVEEFPKDYLAVYMDFDSTFSSSICLIQYEDGVFTDGTIATIAGKEIVV